MSTVTWPPEAGPFAPTNSQTRDRTFARADRIAVRDLGPAVARASTSRETVGSEATGPNTDGSHRGIATSEMRVPAQRDRRSKVHQDLPGIVNGPRLAPGRQLRGYRLVKADLADRLQQQNRTGLRDHLPSVSLGTDTWV